MKIVRYEHDGESIETQPVGSQVEGQPLVRLTMLGFSDSHGCEVEVFMHLPLAEAREFADSIKEAAWGAEKVTQ